MNVIDFVLPTGYAVDNNEGHCPMSINFCNISSVCTIRVVHPFVYTAYVQPIRLNPNFIGGGVPALAMGKMTMV